LVVLVDALAPFGYDSLVPRGLLREPARHLARADAVWVTHCDLVRGQDLEGILLRVGRLAPGARVWETVHAPVRLRRLEGQGERDPQELRGRRVCALSGLGNPLGFERTLERLGAVIVGRARFPDHHAYREEELREVAAGEAAGAEWIVTTEKDAVRLPGGSVGKPIWSLEVELAGKGGAPGLSEELGCLVREKVRT
jgi:tetraacyldisaccharide 4'-kinase